MKKALLSLLIVLTGLFLVSCAHQVSTVGVGNSFSIGGGEYGSIRYADGLFANFVTKDGILFRADIDSTTGFSYDPKANTYKGIKSITYEIAPQITGYAVDLGKENPEAAKAYYEALGKYYEYRGKTFVTYQISDEKSNAATKSVTSVIAEAIKKAKTFLKGNVSNDPEQIFQCNGNCEYTDLSGNKSIAYQLSIAMTLLKYDGYEKRMPDTDEYYTTTIEHFITQLVTLQGEGKTESSLRFKRVKVEDKVITDLLYVNESDGEDYEVTCPSCVTVH